MTIAHVADIGTAGTKSSGVSLIVTLSAGASVGDIVIVSGVDNGLTLGAISDSKSNTWSTKNLVFAGNYNLNLWYSTLTTALVTNDTITVAISGGSGLKFALGVSRFTYGNGVNAVRTATGAGANYTTSTTPTTFADTPADAADLIVGMLGHDGPTGDTFTEDTDNNGGDTWHSFPVAGTTGGSATGNVTMRSAYKITTSLVDQTYNPSLGTGRTGSIGICELRETVASVSPRRLPRYGQSLMRAATR